MGRCCVIHVVAAVLVFAGATASAVAEPGQIVAGRFVPPAPKSGYSYPDCYCRDSGGQRVELGERACLKIGPREVMARCDMSQNIPIWRTEQEGCPVS
ncbi:hypothetical protein [Acuticoccus kandeliae]|uniref:hypothetical protein n=1 Tax=Acuticoccus kandeliae TaxID=2073160 RepID=UPI000D3E3808|nr:hypothetical protein [Acuticoccus kandeliae]